MWLFIKDGFLSAVQHRDYPEKLMIRFRLRQDAERITGKLGIELSETPNADYRFRCIVDKTVFADYMQQAVTDLDYPNFKNAVHDGTRRDNAYMGVWSVMHGLQDAAT